MLKLLNLFPSHFNFNEQMLAIVRLIPFVRNIGNDPCSGERADFIHKLLWARAMVHEFDCGLAVCKGDAETASDQTLVPVDLEIHGEYLNANTVQHSWML